MPDYTIRLRGCDDVTMFYLSLNDDEAELLRLVEAKSVEHGGGCQPTLAVLEGIVDA